MSASNLLTFALASLAMIALPGPDQALITRNALAGGASAARRTMLGGAAGLSVHATAATLGISALLATSAAAFTTLKLVGVVYLVFLAIRMLTTRSASLGEAVRGPRHPFAQGLLSNALNPKVALFFLTFLPQFLPARGSSLPTAFALSGIFALLYLAWFSALIATVDRLGRALNSPRVRRRLERITATALLGFAVRLATSAKP